MGRAIDLVGQTFGRLTVVLAVGVRTLAHIAELADAERYAYFRHFGHMAATVVGAIAGFALLG